MGLLSLIVIVLIAVALLAPAKLAGAGGSFGQAVRAFKEGLNGEAKKDPGKAEKADRD